MRRPMRSKRGREEEEEKETGRRNPKVPKGIDGNLLRKNRNSLLTLGAVTLEDAKAAERGQNRRSRQEVLKVLGKTSTKRASSPASPFLYRNRNRGVPFRDRNRVRGADKSARIISQTEVARKEGSVQGTTLQSMGAACVVAAKAIQWLSASAQGQTRGSIPQEKRQLQKDGWIQTQYPLKTQRKA